MYFYEINVKTKSNQWFNESEDRRKEREIAYEIQDRSEQYCAELEKYCFWIRAIRGGFVYIGAIFQEKSISNVLIEEYLKKLRIECVENISIKEVTFNDSVNALSQGDRMDYVSDDSIMLEKFGIEELRPGYGRDIKFKEYLATETT